MIPLLEFMKVISNLHEVFNIIDALFNEGSSTNVGGSCLGILLQVYAIDLSFKSGCVNGWQVRIKQAQ